MLRCMRTTVRLDDALLSMAKRHAAETGTTLTALIEDALRERLYRRAERTAPTGPLRLRTCGGGGTHPGIDLDDSASLLDAMDGSR